MAVKEALSWLKQKSWPKVEMESDCLVVIQAIRKAIRSRVPMFSPLGQIIEECCRDIQFSNKVSLYFIKRSANMLIHEFARISYKFSDREFDRSNVPIELEDCIRKVLVYILLDLQATQMTSECEGKSSWPELVGERGEAAAATIEKENPNVNANLVPEGSSVILDFRCDRVWVWINKDGFVISTPRIG